MASAGLHAALGLVVLVERSSLSGLAEPPAIEASLIDAPAPSLAASAQPSTSAERPLPPANAPVPRMRPLDLPPPPDALAVASPGSTTTDAPVLPMLAAPGPKARSSLSEETGPMGAAAPGGAPVRQRGAATQARDPYAARVLAWLEERKHMPEDLRRRRARGVVVVAFSLDRWGRLSRPTVVRSSGDRAVDAAALDLLATAAPFPKAPREAEWNRRDFEMPIDYAALEVS